MKLIQIFFSLTSLAFFSAIATPADVGPRTDRPISLPLEAIPAGATIYGLDGNSNKMPLGKIAKRAVTNSTECLTGSILPCLLGLPSAAACNAAAGAFDDKAWYCGDTSRFSDHCAAEFGCVHFNYCWAGWYIKDSFRQISCELPVTRCGTRYFENGNCYTSYDYCINCG